MDGLCQTYRENPLMTSVDFGLRVARLNSAPLALVLVEIKQFESLGQRYAQHLHDCVKLVRASINHSLASSGDLYVTWFAQEMFGGILPGASPGVALTIAANILKNLAGITIPYRYSSICHKVEFSIGVGVMQQVQKECVAEHVVALACSALDLARGVDSPQIMVF
ncbi:MAG: hypothetical protein RBR02_04155 [Desulfuromonadaceae bacterium]|nr:hypothetical protein [Desulfuromonadaceae bacterium]